MPPPAGPSATRSAPAPSVGLSRGPVAPRTSTITDMSVGASVPGESIAPDRPDPLQPMIGSIPASDATIRMRTSTVRLCSKVQTNDQKTEGATPCPRCGDPWRLIESRGHMEVFASERCGLSQASMVSRPSDWAGAPPVQYVTLAVRFTGEPIPAKALLAVRQASPRVAIPVPQIPVGGEMIRSRWIAHLGSRNRWHGRPPLACQANAYQPTATAAKRGLVGDSSRADSRRQAGLR